jgi:hypothetical protein
MQHGEKMDEEKESEDMPPLPNVRSRSTSGAEYNHGAANGVNHGSTASASSTSNSNAVMTKPTPRKYHAFSTDSMGPVNGVPHTLSGEHNPNALGGSHNGASASSSAAAAGAGATESMDEMFHIEEGTPLAAALAANATIQVGNKYQKSIQRKLRGLKRPKMKAKNFKKFNLVRQLGNIKHKKEKLFSQNFKGKVIDGVHELYTLTVGMMLGLRCSVGNIGSTNYESKTNLVLEDFQFVEKREFKPAGTSTPFYKTPSHQLGHTFKFKSYAPEVFKRIRQFCGIDEASYMMSICGNSNFIEFMSNSKSGSFFFYSHDGQSSFVLFVCIDD